MSRIKFTPLSPDKPVRIAVIGVGGAAQIIHLPILSEMDDVELVGICDLEAFKVGRISDKYSVQGFVDGVNLLKHTSPDVVFICSPTISHLPLALLAMESGSHVIIEKPVARNLEETKRLADFAAQKGLLALVAMNLRFRQDVSVLKNFLDAGELGKLWRIRTGWLMKRGTWQRNSWLHQANISGGGVMMDLGLQLLDVVQWILDHPTPRRISAVAQNIGLGLAVEDTITATIEYTNDIFLQLDCSWGLLAERNVAYAYMEGTEGSAKLDPLEIFKTIQGELVNVSPVKSAAARDLYKASFHAQLHYFIQVLRGDKEPISTIDDAYETMQMVNWIYQSAQQKHEIIINGA